MGEKLFVCMLASFHGRRGRRLTEIKVIDNNNEVLIKREPLVLAELGALYRKKKKKKKKKKG